MNIDKYLERKTKGEIAPQISRLPICAHSYFCVLVCLIVLLRFYKTKKKKLHSI